MNGMINYLTTKNRLLVTVNIKVSTLSDFLKRLDTYW